MNFNSNELQVSKMKKQQMTIIYLKFNFTSLTVQKEGIARSMSSYCVLTAKFQNKLISQNFFVHC